MTVYRHQKKLKICHYSKESSEAEVLPLLKNCETIVNLLIWENGQITREKKIDTYKLNADGKWASNGNTLMKYRKVEMNEIQIRYEWTRVLENYNNEEKHKPCN